MIDAFVIRGTLVPAFMRLAGEWNWWAPGPLRRLHDKIGISEHVDLDGRPATPEVPTARRAPLPDPLVRPLKPGVGRLKAATPATGTSAADRDPAGVAG
jgi:hypothetical protein